MSPARRSFGEVWRKKRGNGSVAWFARYRVAGKRVCKVAGKTKDEATAFLAARQIEAAHARLDGRPLSPRLSLAEFEETLLAHWRARLEKTTVASRVPLLRRAVKHFGKRSMADVTRGDVETWCESLGLAPSSTKQALLALSAAFTVAMRRGVVRENPCSGAKTARIADSPRPWLDAEQLAAIVAKMPDAIRPIVVFISETGARRAEALGLRWKDLDGDGVTFRGKGGTTRRVHLSLAARQAVADVRAVRPGLPEAKLWTIHAPQFNQSFRAGADAAGMHDVTPHTLRHAFASGLVRAGVDLPTVMRLLGHRRIETTMRYAGWAPADAGVRAIEALERARQGLTRDIHSTTAEARTT